MHGPGPPPPTRRQTGCVDAFDFDKVLREQASVALEWLIGCQSDDSMLRLPSCPSANRRYFESAHGQRPYPRPSPRSRRTAQCARTRPFERMAADFPTAAASTLRIASGWRSGAGGASRHASRDPFACLACVSQLTPRGNAGAWNATTRAQARCCTSSKFQCVRQCACLHAWE